MIDLATLNGVINPIFKIKHIDETENKMILMKSINLPFFDRKA